MPIYREYAEEEESAKTDRPSQKPNEVNVQSAKMSKGTLTTPNAAGKSQMKNPDMHTFDLAVKSLLVILTRPQWIEKWREQEIQAVGMILTKCLVLRRKEVCH